MQREQHQFAASHPAVLIDPDELAALSGIDLGEVFGWDGLHCGEALGQVLRRTLADMALTAVGLQTTSTDLGLTGTTGSDVLTVSSRAQSGVAIGGDGDDLLRFGAGLEPARLVGVGEVVLQARSVSFGGGLTLGVQSVETIRLINGADAVDLDRATIAVEAGRSSDWCDLSIRADQASLGSDDDVGFGRAGHDTIQGGDGGDWVMGGDSDDLLDGGCGRDALSGDGGFDRLRGGSGDDALSGSTGPDALEGGSGNDRLSGAADGDRLQGSSGRDVFVFKPKEGADMAADFRHASNLLDLSALGFSWSDFETSRQGRDLHVAFGGVVEIVLIGLGSHGLERSHVIL